MARCGSLATFARFAAMNGTPVGEMPQRDRDLLVALHSVYDMTRHGESGSAQGDLVAGTDFIDRFGINQMEVTRAKFVREVFPPLRSVPQSAVGAA